MHYKHQYTLRVSNGTICCGHFGSSGVPACKCGKIYDIRSTARSLGWKGHQMLPMLIARTTTKHSATPNIRYMLPTAAGE